MANYRSNFDMSHQTYWSSFVYESGNETEAHVYNFSTTTSFHKNTNAKNYVRAVRTYNRFRRE
jgi:hypothetical protein